MTRGRCPRKLLSPDNNFLGHRPPHELLDPRLRDDPLRIRDPRHLAVVGHADIQHPIQPTITELAGVPVESTSAVLLNRNPRILIRIKTREQPPNMKDHRTQQEKFVLTSTSSTGRDVR